MIRRITNVIPSPIRGSRTWAPSETAAALAITAVGALAVNLTCALLLVRHRHHAGSLTKAAWLSARNDAVANIAIIGVGVLTMWFVTGWLDIVVGIGIALLNVDAARSVWRAARLEAKAQP